LGGGTELLPVQPDPVRCEMLLGSTRLFQLVLPLAHRLILLLHQSLLDLLVQLVRLASRTKCSLQRMRSRFWKETNLILNTP
jgi:hypothetical protein